jgi:hypothetical protein
VRVCPPVAGGPTPCVSFPHFDREATQEPLTLTTACVLARGLGEPRAGAPAPCNPILSRGALADWRAGALGPLEGCCRGVLQLRFGIVPPSSIRRWRRTGRPARVRVRVRVFVRNRRFVHFRDTVPLFQDRHHAPNLLHHCCVRMCVRTPACVRPPTVRDTPPPVGASHSIIQRSESCARAPSQAPAAARPQARRSEARTRNPTAGSAAPGRQPQPAGWHAPMVIRC